MTIYPPIPTDTNGIPIDAIWVPGTGWVPKQAGTPTADSNGYVSAPLNTASSGSGGSSSNASVGVDGAAIPTSSTLMGGSDGTNLQPLQVDGSKNLKVAIAAGVANQRVNAQSGDFADGALVTEGAKADAAITDATTTNSKMSFLKGLVKIWADVWDGTNHWLQVKVMNGNSNGIATSVNSAPIVTASDDANFAALKPSVQGWIAPTGTGTATTDDSLIFANQVRKVMLYNASANPIPIEFDQTASATSFPMPAGAYWILDNVYCTAVHVFPSATLPINTTAGLYIKGWK